MSRFTRAVYAEAASLLLAPNDPLRPVLEQVWHQPEVPDLPDVVAPVTAATPGDHLRQAVAALAAGQEPAALDAALAAFTTRPAASEPLRLTVATGHSMPDLDALSSVAALWYLLERAPGAYVRFDSRPDVAVWHRPTDGYYTVDIGKTDLDHHQFRNRRSTCAFVRVCCSVMMHGDDAQRVRAAALLTRIGPGVFRQDTTGTLTDPRDPAVEVLDLPKEIGRATWDLQDDQAVWTEFWPRFRRLFAEAVAGYTAEHDPQAVLAQVDLQTSACGRVVGWVQEQVQGEFSPLSSIRAIVWDQFPACEVQVQITRWTDQGGQTLTWSVGIGTQRRKGEPPFYDAGALVDALLPRAPADIAEELQRWHREDWFAGRGGTKNPDDCPPPGGLVAWLVPALAALPADA